MALAIRSVRNFWVFSGRVDGKAVYLCCCCFAVLAACMVYGFEGQSKQNRSVISKMFSPSFHSQLPRFHEAYYTGYKYLMASFLVWSKTTTGLPAVELCQAFN